MTTKFTEKEAGLLTLIFCETENYKAEGREYGIDVDLEYWAASLNGSVKTLKGVLGSLVKKDVFYLNEDFWGKGKHTIDFPERG